ncbi:MAG: 3-hydroxyacyl-CoA dehydrogenase family protein [Candidatus Helarchaeota archaeon]
MVDISNIKNITVIGAGLMGGYIAQLALLAGFEKVILNDVKPESIEKCLSRIENGAYDEKEGLRAIEAAGKLEDGITTDILLGRLRKELDLTKAVKDADIVIEAVPEDLKLKQEIFEKLGKLAPSHAILASNSSTISITKIAEYSGRPEQVVGMHFFVPLFENRLIELIRGENTSDEVMDTCVALGEKFPCPYFKDKMYVARIEKESPGFIVNRIFSVLGIYLNWLGEQALEKGMTWEDINREVSITGDEMGWIALLDYSGLDIVYDGLSYLHETLTPDIEPHQFLIDLVKSGNLGAKTGKGFLEWPNGKIPKPDKTKKPGSISMTQTGLITIPQLLDALMAIMLNEGCRLLEEGVISGYLVFNKVMAAMKLPSAFSMAKRNYEKWIILLDELAEKTGKNYLKPCKLMKSGDFLNMKK